MKRTAPIALILACTLAACSGDSAEPPAPRPIDRFLGTWTLQARDGNALPFAETATATDTVMHVHGTLEINPGVEGVLQSWASYVDSAYAAHYIGPSVGWMRFTRTSSAVYDITVLGDTLEMLRRAGRGSMTQTFVLRGGLLVRIADSGTEYDERWERLP